MEGVVVESPTKGVNLLFIVYGKFNQSCDSGFPIPISYFLPWVSSIDPWVQQNSTQLNFNDFLPSDLRSRLLRNKKDTKLEFQGVIYPYHSNLTVYFTRFEFSRTHLLTHTLKFTQTFLKQGIRTLPGSFQFHGGCFFCLLFRAPRLSLGGVTTGGWWCLRPSLVLQWRRCSHHQLLEAAGLVVVVADACESKVDTGGIS